MDLLKLMEKIARKLAPGRAPTFMEVHIVKALETISIEEAVGRIKLSKRWG
jgi:hypothetical protein